MKVVLITGPNGFIGQHLVDYLKKTHADYKIKTISREAHSPDSISYQNFISNNYDSKFFDDVTDVVHLAAIAHKFGFNDQAQLDEININYPARLLEVLKTKSLEKFIFMSSVAVSLLEKGIVLDTKAYAETKKMAEAALIKTKQGSNVKLIFIRPPMVYGRNAPGNFERLVKLLKYPLPIPFGSMTFQKPAIHVLNLVSAIASMIQSQNLKSNSYAYELSDPFKIGFNQYLRKLNTATGGKSFIIPFPLGLLKFLLSIFGRKQLYEKLVLTYQVSNEKIEQDFDWPKPIDQGKMFNDLKP
ncbi:hypothetical protein C0V70_01735 [Bacteriovorax stolpii]|uniref:Uncharacterized protein n=1 Tax=Bacteriovorax stolpii TaxID=960 RepID=A0A2K9NP45_BACTC|nr:NAD-dependent epimerase/dehydratase family protein [Bacteriovorax stolpii]AUN96845.1 hypothetical protein C0V70_01735 [Bacteriovorax stolpii]TDP53123.1 nucleoside-diphosphate-sugar epimerase [Bacteriovorax stolpii]